jgi:hypothetical protein
VQKPIMALGLERTVFLSGPAHCQWRTRAGFVPWISVDRNFRHWQIYICGCVYMQIYLCMCIFYVAHNPSITLIIHYLTQQITQIIIIIIYPFCSFYMFRPLKGHHHGGIFRGKQVQKILSNMCMCRVKLQYSRISLYDGVTFSNVRL